MSLAPTFQLDRRVCAELLSEADTPATVVLTILLAAYPDIMSAEDAPDVLELWADVQEDFSVSVHEDNENKVNAMLLALTTDAFYEDPEAFEAISLGLGGDLGDLTEGVMEDVSVSEMMWAAWEVSLWRTDDPDFSESVRRIWMKELRREMEEKDLETPEILPWFERGIVQGKTEIVRDFMRMGAPQESVQHVVTSDTTPLLDENGKLVNLSN